MHNWTEPQPSPAPTEAGRCTSTSICRFRVPSCSCRHDCLSGEWVLQLVKMENAVFLLWFYYSIGIIKLKPCHVVPSAHPDLQVQSGLIWCSYCYSHSQQQKPLTCFILQETKNCLLKFYYTRQFWTESSSTASCPLHDQDAPLSSPTEA
jgi:hypothetical protein